MSTPNPQESSFLLRTSEEYLRKFRDLVFEKSLDIFIKVKGKRASESLNKFGDLTPATSMPAEQQDDLA